MSASPKFAIKMRFYDGVVRYFVGFDGNDEDWAMSIDNASHYSLREAQAIADLNDFTDANVYSLVPVTTAFIIQDWTGKVCFFGKEFESFEEAEEWLIVRLGDAYEDERQEYYIEESK
jgi:hypothetical protein